jgi:hypothetical protein
LLNSSRNALDPFNTLAPPTSSDRIKDRANGTARVLPLTYALGLA